MLTISAEEENLCEPKITREHRRLVLCIDDDRAITSSLLMFLASKRFEVERAQTTRQALKKIFKRRQPDLIITDLELLGGSGIDIVQQVKSSEATCRIPILVVTGSDNDAWLHELEALGVSRVFRKPCSFRAVAAEVQSHFPAIDKTDATKTSNEKPTLTVVG